MAYSDAVNAEASLQSYWRLNDSGATADDSKSTIDGTYDGLVSKQQPGLLPNDGDFGIVTSRADAAAVKYGGFSGISTMWHSGGMPDTRTWPTLLNYRKTDNTLPTSIMYYGGFIRGSTMYDVSI